MQHPTPEQVQTVIDNFESIKHLVKDKSQINMSEPSVKSSGNCELDDAGYACGTVHCHGGWYAVALIQNNSLDIDGLEYVSYSEGAASMAAHLGFDDEIKLQRWAGQNPSIWGNEYGDSMFYVEAAFVGVVYNDLDELMEIEGMQTIIDHWKGVKKRLEEVS